MGILSGNLNEWLKRRTKGYKQAIEDYCGALEVELEKDFERRVEKLRSRSMTILLDCSKKNTIKGLTLIRKSQVDFLLNERVILIDRRTKKRISQGHIVELDGQYVKLKLNKKLELSTLLKFDEDQAAISLEVTPHHRAVNADENEEQKNCQDELSNEKNPNGKNLNEKNLEAKRSDEEGISEAVPRALQREVDIILSKRNIYDRSNRIKNSLCEFRINSCSTRIQNCLMSQHNDSRNTRYKKSRPIHQTLLGRPLKGSQVMAVDEAMTKRIALIEGVAGSGKTLVAASIACSMSSLRGKRILLCSPLQSTVDRMAEMIRTVQSVHVVQLNSTNELRKYGNQYKDYLLKAIVNATIKQKRLNKYRIKGANSMTPKDIREREEQAQRAVKTASRWLKEKIEKEVLKAADIVCCSLFQAGRKCLKNIKFDMLIIDDVHLTTEADCLVAMMAKGLKQVTLLSEIRRDVRFAKSSPSVTASGPNRSNELKTLKITKRTKVKNPSEEDLINLIDQEKHHDAERWGPTSVGAFFERLLTLGLSSVVLKHQFRMHPTIANFPRTQFYLSRLETESNIDEEFKKLVNGIDRDCLKSCNRMSRLFDNRKLTAIFNAENNHAINDIVSDIVNELVDNLSINPSKIGIITNTQDELRFSAFRGFEVATIRHYLGQERDFIILCCFNTNDKLEINSGLDELYCNAIYDYLRDDEALNIATTRARFGLIIVTNLSDILDDINTECQPKQIDDPEKHAVETKPYCKSWIELVRFYKTNMLTANETQNSP